MNRSDLLSPFGWLYGAIAGARRALYEKGVLESFDLGVATISVGNLSVGGTGKTPLVAYAARVLAERGEKVCILTRGYKRENEGERVLVSDGEEILADAKRAGDEPLELARKLVGKASVVADADRARAGEWARSNLGATVFLLDDGFQHLRVRRDLDIVCVDATNPFGERKLLLPAGILREPPRSLRRAGAVVITRANLAEEKQIAALKTEISRHNRMGKIFVSKSSTASLTELLEFNAGAIESAAARRARENPGQRTEENFVAFCALGNAEGFFRQLGLEHFNLTATKKFPDHHFYAQTDIDELAETARKKGASALLTTAKDAVKMAGLKIDLPCFVAESELVFDDEENFKNLIIGAVKARRTKV